MQKYFTLIIANLYHFFYRCARYAYRIFKKLIKKILPSHPNPYDNISLYPNDLKIDIIDKNYLPNINSPKYTTITPVLNEEKTIVGVLKSIENQTLLPDQVIIVDGGSSDSTAEKIQEYKKNSKLNILLLFAPVKNIGVQRNIAIKNATNNILMNVDAGTYLDKNYAANTIGLFFEYNDLDLVSGVHYPKEKYLWSVYLSPSKHFEFRVEPYGACLVYRKDITLKIGMYPEYLDYAGEDTLFCYKYKKVSKHWIFNREAFILWDHPPTLSATKEKVFNYTTANFQIGLWPYFYNSYILEPDINLGWQSEILKKNYSNFLIHQSDTEISKRKIKGLCFILSSNEIKNDPKQENIKNLISTSIQNNLKTFFINFNFHLPNRKQKNKKKVFLDIDHTLLELQYYKFFSIDELRLRYGKFLEYSLFIIQYPHKNICNKIFELKKVFQKIIIIYDFIGDDQSISKYRYSPIIDEKNIILNADWIIVQSDKLSDLKNKKYIKDTLSFNNRIITINTQQEKIKKIEEIAKWEIIS